MSVSSTEICQTFRQLLPETRTDAYTEFRTLMIRRPKQLLLPIVVSFLERSLGIRTCLPSVPLSMVLSVKCYIGRNYFLPFWKKISLETLFSLPLDRHCVILLLAPCSSSPAILLLSFRPFQAWQELFLIRIHVIIQRTSLRQLVVILYVHTFV